MAGLSSVIQLCKVLNSESKSTPDLMSIVTKHPERDNYNIEFKDKVDPKLIVYPK